MPRLNNLLSELLPPLISLIKAAGIFLGIRWASRNEYKKEQLEDQNEVQKKQLEIASRPRRSWDDLIERMRNNGL